MLCNSNQTILINKSALEILIRLRDENCILNDWKNLMTRFKEKLSNIEKKGFKKVIFLLING